MYATSTWEVSTGKQSETWTDTSYQGGTDTRCFIWRKPQPDNSNTYRGSVCAHEYDNNSVTINAKVYLNGELQQDINTNYAVDSHYDTTYDGYFNSTFNVGSDTVYKLKTNFPIFKEDPNDQESVDAVKRYVESGDISGAENYAELMSPVVRVTVKLSPESAPVAYISTKAQYPEGSPFNDGDFSLRRLGASGAEAGSSTLPIDGGSEQIQYYAMNPQPPIFKTSYTLAFTLTGKIGGHANINQRAEVKVCKNTADSEVLSEEPNLHIILIKEGTPSEDDKFQDDDNNTNPNHDPTAPPTVVDGGNVSTLSTTYKLTEAQMKSLGNFLWSANFTDDIHLVNESPIQNIVSSMAMPVSISGSSQNIKIVNVDTGVGAIKCNKQVVRLDNVGHYGPIQPQMWENCPRPEDYSPYCSGMAMAQNKPLTWLDYEHTSMTLYLPFIGFKTINTRQFMGKSISVSYVFDVVAGACEALVFYVVPSTGRKVLVHRFGGTCGINIPLTARDNTQYLASMATNLLGSATNLIGGALSGNVGSMLSGLTGAVNSATQHIHQDSTGTPSPMCSTLIDTNIYILIERPRARIPKNYGHNHGWNCHFNAIIKNLNGYTKLDRVDLSGLTCTASERAHIKELLEGGFYTGNRS